MPASWPPGEYDRDAQQFFLERPTSTGDAGVGWYVRYAVRAAVDGAPATVVACGGYFAPPPEAGVVEIGYSVRQEWDGWGYATEMAAVLAAHALRQPGVTRVVAHTTAANPASIEVLDRSGFVLDGDGAEPGTLRFAYTAHPPAPRIRNPERPVGRPVLGPEGRLRPGHRARSAAGSTRTARTRGRWRKDGPAPRSRAVRRSFAYPRIR